MAQGDILKRYLDAGVAFTQMTRERAEVIVQELVKAGEIRRKEAEDRIEELVDRSRKNTEELLAIIRREVAEQLKNLGLDDLAKRAGARATETPAAPAAAPVAAAAAKKASVAKKAPVAKKAGAAKKATVKTVKKSGGAKKARP